MLWHMNRADVMLDLKISMVSSLFTYSCRLWNSFQKNIWKSQDTFYNVSTLDDNVVLKESRRSVVGSVLAY